MEEILHRPEKSSDLNVCNNILKCQGKYFSQPFPRVYMSICGISAFYRESHDN